MIPVRLVVEGLYSYQERIEIDFSLLTASRLFGIFGKVGSGKSALLEAITFALYGKTERISAKRNYNMMNLRSDRLYIDFEFEVGTDEERHRYRFEVKSRRNSKQFEDVKKYERTGFQWRETEWIPLESNDAQHILHLSYDHFIKTIIIPQGKFQEFLHMTATPRTEMMKEMFALHQYDLADANKLLKAENEEQVNRLSGRLEEIPEVSQEALASAEKDLLAQQEQLAAIQVRLKALTEEELEWKQIREIKQELEQVEEMLGKLVPEEAAFQNRKKRLSRFTMVKNVFDESLRRQAAYQERFKALGEIVPLLQNTLQEYEAMQVQLDHDFKEASTAFDERDIWKEKAGELFVLAEIQEIRTALVTLAARQTKGKQVLAEGQKALQTEQEVLEKIREKLESLRAEMPDSNLLLELQKWFHTATHLKQLHEGAIASLASAKTDHEASDADFTAWLAQPLVQSVAVDAGRDLGDLATHLETVLQAEQEALDALHTRQRETEVHARLNDYAAALTVGEPCPLCGATEHPHPTTSAEIEERLAQFKQEGEAIQYRIRSLTRLQPELKSWLDRKERDTREAARLEKAMVECMVQLESHQATFLWPEFSPDRPGQVTELIEKSKAMRQKEAAMRGEVETQRNTLDGKVKDLERYQTALQQLAQEEAGFQGQLVSKQADLQHFSETTFQGETPETLREKGQVHQEKYDAIGTRFRELQLQLDQHKEALLTKQNELNTVKHDLKTVGGELKVLDEALAEKVSLNGLADVAEAKSILDWEIDPQAEADAIEEFEKDLLDARHEHATWKKKEAGRKYDAERHAAVANLIAEGEIERSGAEREKARMEVGVEKMRKDRAARAGLQEEMEGLRIRAENLKVMEGLFRKAGFVNYVSTIYLRELCERANARFQQLTRHQLSLVLDDQNDFQIRDNLNDGRVRSVRTLSGGQTFQASLCLALALADNITQRMGNTQNFFFLDEGFGSLDRESLNLVFETLKQLRKENRIVGVISHVEDLQQEIPQYLHIHKDEERGSQVSESWSR